MPNSFRQIRPKILARDRHSDKAQELNYLFKGGARNRNIVLKKERETENWNRKSLKPFLLERTLHSEFIERHPSLVCYEDRKTKN